jgi:hypothetical protein
MTNKDFDLIATALAAVETEIEEMPDPSGGQDKQTARATFIFTVRKISAALKESHPRFNPGTFEKWAMPIAEAKLKAAILAKLESGEQNV